MAVCEICGNKIGFFSKPFTTDKGTKVCKDCISNVDSVLLSENITSAQNIAYFMDNSVGDTYLNSIGVQTMSEKLKQEEDLQKAELEKQRIEKEEDEKRLNKFKEAQEKAERQEIYHFKVHGTTHHELSKMVTYARKNKLFDPYDGYTASEIKEYSPYEEVYETDLVGLLSAIDFVPEPDNKYDSNAVKIIVTLDNNKFMIGYVPAKYTNDVLEIMQRQKNSEISLRIEYNLTGGKYKIAEDDEDDFSDDPKLKIHTAKQEYGFNIRMFDKNIE